MIVASTLTKLLSENSKMKPERARKKCKNGWWESLDPVFRREMLSEIQSCWGCSRRVTSNSLELKPSSPTFHLASKTIFQPRALLKRRSSFFLLLRAKSISKRCFATFNDKWFDCITNIFNSNCRIIGNYSHTFWWWDEFKFLNHEFRYLCHKISWEWYLPIKLN